MNDVKKTSYYKILLVMSMMIGLASLQGTTEPNSTSEGYMNDDSVNQSYITLYNLRINGNWSAVESTYSWCTGAGTVGDPYAVDGIEVNGLFSGSCLVISNTADHFIIENSRFFNGGDSSGSAGIDLNNVQNGVIRNTTISDVYEGVSIDTNSDSISVTNNDWLDGTLTYGIYAVGATNLNISYNNILADYDGVVFLTTTSSFIKYNNFTAGLSGIALPYDSNHNIIEDNILQDCGIITSNGGISSSGSLNNTIYRNTIKDLNSPLNNYGIWISGGSSQNNVSENMLSNISYYYPLGDGEYRGVAIMITDSNNNNITNNTITNSENGIATSDSINNIISGNNISIYQECIYGNSIDFNTVNGNVCAVIERPTGDNGNPTISFGNFFLNVTLVSVALLVAFKIKNHHSRDGREEKNP